MSIEVDPTTLAVVRGYLEEVVDEMDVVQVKAAFSPIVSEMRDRANGLFRINSGETVAQGHFGSPIFITTMQHAVQSVVRWLSDHERAWEPGDAYLLNDPFLGGTHLQDAKLVSPFFWEGRPVMLLANTGHWMDVGAAQAGAFGPTCRSIFEEGLRLPVMRFARNDQIDPEMLELVRANNRLPDLQEGDLRSQLNALLVGRRRLHRLLERYGPDLVEACIAELDVRSQHQMEERISRIPNGTYRAADFLDDDGVANRPLHVELSITVEGSAMVIDFEGTDPACEGPMNMSTPTTITACYTGLKHLFPEIPINAGCFRPVTVRIPRGCFLGAQAPHAVGGYVEGSGKVVGLIFQALVQAVPEEGNATSFETGGVAVISGEKEGKVFVAAFPYGGGYGASMASDGLVNGTSIVGMASWPSIENSEQDYPIHWNRYGLREGSGGPGRWAGGCGNEYDFTVEVDTILSVLGDQSKSAPAGVLGGLPGAVNDVAYTINGEWQVPEMGAKVPPVQISAGDRVRTRSPGGGGYGPPEERESSSVRRDVALGLLTAEAAAAAYGSSETTPAVSRASISTSE